MSESTLMEVPTGIVTFHMDINEPRVPGKTTFIAYIYSVEETCYVVIHICSLRGTKFLMACQLDILKTGFRITL
jgi:hypothetical protein